MSSAASFSEPEARSTTDRISDAPSARGWRVGRVVAFDQVVFSGANFATAVLIGRFAGRSELGLYSLVIAFVLLISGFQRALTISPYTFQTQRLAGARRRLRRGSAVALSIVAVVLFGAAVLAGWPLCADEEVAGLSGSIVAAALVGWCLRDSFRRLLFADHRYQEAAVIDVAAAVVQITVLLVLGLQGQLTAASALIVLAGTTLAVAGGWLLAARERLLLTRRRLAADMQASWRFGRWSALSEAVYSGQDAAVQVLLSLGGGLTATGMYAACASVVRLANPFVQAVGNAAGPTCARALSDEGVRALSANVQRLSRMTGAAMGLFVLLIACVGPLALTLIYGDDFAGNGLLLVALAAAVGLNGVSMIAAKGVSAFEKPRFNFAINVVGLTITLVVAVGGMQRDVMGAIATGLLAGSVVTATLRWCCFFRMTAAADGGAC